MAIRNISLLGDDSSHGGVIIDTNQDDSVIAVGVPVCVQGCRHSCPIDGHGITTVTAVTVKSYINGKLIVTKGAVAGCGAVITSPDRKVYVE